MAIPEEEIQPFVDSFSTREIRTEEIPQALINNRLVIQLKVCSVEKHAKYIEVNKDSGVISLDNKDFECQICITKKCFERLGDNGFVFRIKDEKNDFYLLECPLGHYEAMKFYQLKDHIKCSACQKNEVLKKYGINIRRYSKRGIIKGSSSFLRWHCYNCGKDLVGSFSDLKGTRTSHKCKKNPINPFITMIAIWEILTGENYDDWTTDLELVRTFGHFPPECYSKENGIALVNGETHKVHYVNNLSQICKEKGISLYKVGKLEKNKDTKMINDFLGFLVEEGKITKEEQAHHTAQIIKELGTRKYEKCMITSQSNEVETPPTSLPSAGSSKKKKKGRIYSKTNCSKVSDNSHPPKGSGTTQ